MIVGKKSSWSKRHKKNPDTSRKDITCGFAPAGDLYSFCMDAMVNTEVFFSTHVFTLPLWPH